MIYGSTFQYKDTDLSLVNIISGTSFELKPDSITYLYFLQGDGTINSKSVESYHKLDIYHIDSGHLTLYANSDSVVLIVCANKELPNDLVKVLGRQISALKYSTKINISALSSYLSVSSKIADEYKVIITEFNQPKPCKAGTLKTQSSELFKILLKALRASHFEGELHAS